MIALQLCADRPAGREIVTRIMGGIIRCDYGELGRTVLGGKNVVDDASADARAQAVLAVLRRDVRHHVGKSTLPRHSESQATKREGNLNLL
jgi:hypothetical protein